MLSDPIADMLARIKNAFMVGKTEVVVPFSKQKEAIAKIMVKEGYLKDLKTQNSKLKTKKIKDLVCELKYEGRNPAITGIKRISHSGVRIYSTAKKLPYGIGTTIISTPKGFMTCKEARKKKLGGEVICKIW